MDKFDTKCIQAGYTPRNGEPRVMPIVQSTTFAYDTPEEMGELFDLKKAGYFYTRISNPTSEGLERKVAELEGGSMAITAASVTRCLLMCRLLVRISISSHRMSQEERSWEKVS